MTGSKKGLFIIMAVAAFFFGACSSNDSTPLISAQPSGDYAVSGLAVKGAVSGGTVNVHALGSDGTRGAVTVTTSTDANGAFFLADPITGPAEVVVTGGTYKDEATGVTVDMTGRELSVILLNGAAQGSTVAVTPLTKIAASQTRHRISILGEDLATAVNNANNDVTHQFGIDGVDITTVPPMDFMGGGATALTVGGIDLDSDAAKYGLVILGLSQTAKDAGRPPEDVLDLVDNIGKDMANSLLDEGDSLPHDFPRSPGDTLCELGYAIDDFLGGSQNPTGVTPYDVDHVTNPNGVDCGVVIAAAPASGGSSCGQMDVLKLTAGDGQVTVNFTPPWDFVSSGPNKTVDIILYYNAGGPPDSGSSKIGEIWRGASSHTVTGLTNDTQYCFGLRQYKGGIGECSFGDILCATPTGDGGSCQQDCAAFANDIAQSEEDCDEDPDGCGEIFYDAFMYCVSEDYDYGERVTRHIDGHEESCGNNDCEVNLCDEGFEGGGCWDQAYVGGEIDYDRYQSCMTTCVESGENASFCTPPAISLWPSGDAESLACGVTVTDGSVDDADGRVNGCIDIDLNWTDVPGANEYELNADYNNDGSWWNAYDYFDGSTTTSPPFRVCAQDASVCDGLPCTFTDNYHGSVWTNNHHVESNECAITFDFPAPQEPEPEPETLTLMAVSEGGSIFGCDIIIPLSDNPWTPNTFQLLWNDVSSSETNYVFMADYDSFSFTSWDGIEAYPADTIESDPLRSSWEEVEAGGCDIGSIEGTLYATCTDTYRVVSEIDGVTLAISNDCTVTWSVWSPPPLE